MNSNSSKPLIDIVITAHNMESCLGECLQSLAAQTFGGFCALGGIDIAIAYTLLIRH